MSFSYNPGDGGVGDVRLLIQDTDNTSEIGPLFQDEEIQVFLNLEQGVVRYTAAALLETTATSTLLIEKKMKLQDLETDAPAVAQELRTLAAQLRTSEENMSYFAVAEMVNNSFGARERIYKQFQRRAS